MRPSSILKPEKKLIEIAIDDAPEAGEAKERKRSRSKIRTETVEELMIPDPTATILLLKDKVGCNVLIEAARNGYADCVYALMKHGANPMHQDKEKWSPLHYAAALGHMAVAKVLLESDYQNKKMGEAQLLLLDRRKRTPLLLAAKNGQFEVNIKLSLPSLFADASIDYGTLLV
jgi:ankyrin repeat protein